MEVEEVFSRFRELNRGAKAKKKSTSFSFGEHRSAFKGSGYDIVGVDQWRDGQPLKDIAWSLSLRTYPDKIFKIERMEPKEMRTILVVDLSYSMLFKILHDANKARLLLDLVGGIGLTRAHLRDPVGLLGFSDRVELYLRPKLGSGQVFYMAWLIFEKVEFEREYPTRRKTDLSIPLNLLASRLRLRHSLVIISDLVDLLNEPDSIDFRLLGRLASKHDMIVLILDDPEEFVVRSRLGYVRTTNMETGEEVVMSARRAAAVRRQLEESRERLMADLKRRAGVDSVVLTPGNHFEELSTFLMARSGRR